METFRYTYLISIFLTIVTIVKGQDTFAPVGAKWTYHWYTRVSLGKPNLYLDTNATTTITAIKDTLVSGKNCRKLEMQVHSNACYLDYNFVYSDSGRVYFYNGSSWQLLFDINKNIGESFLQSSVTLTVTATSTININGKTLKVIDCSDHNRYIENIGCTKYFFSIQSSDCLEGMAGSGTGGRWGDIKCYSDSLIGDYDFGNCNTFTAQINQSCFTLYSSSATGNQWYLNDTAISGATSQKYTPTQDGSYTLIVTIDSIVTAPSSPVVITFPSITQTGLVLTSSSASHNIWFLNDTTISGATSQTYTAKQNGTYLLEVISNGCGSMASDSVVISSIGTGTGIIQNSIDGTFSIYPNPNNGIFTLQSVGKISSIEVTNTLGTIVLLQQINADKAIIDLSKETNGNYFIKIISQQGTTTNTKVILTH